MIEIKKRQILFGVLLDSGKYDERELAEKIAQKNGWDMEKSEKIIKQIFGSEKIKEVKTEEKQEEKSESKKRSRSKK